MASRAKTRKHVANTAIKKTTRTRAKALRKSTPGRKAYVDLPGRRYRELIQDRRFGSEGKNLAQLRLNAIQQKFAAAARQAGAMPTPITPGINNWVQLGPTAIPNGQTYGGTRVLVTGRIIGIVIDPTSPDTIYAAAARGGVWKTIDGGASWTPKSDNEVSLALGALAMAPSDHNRLYAGTGEGNIFYYAQNFPLNSINEDYHGVGVLCSSNAGDTWTHAGAATFTGAAFYRIGVHPTNPDVLMGATTFGLFRSQDGGTTWTAMTSGLPAISITVLACTDVVYDPTNGNRAWCAFWASGIYRTDNANATTPTWTKLTTGLPTTDMSRISLAVAPSNHDAVFALVANAGDSLKAVYGSTDGGDNWTTVTTSATIDLYGAYTANIAVDISTTDVLYVSGVDLYKCVLSGGTWSVTDVGSAFHPDNHAFATHPTNNLKIYAGSDGGIYRSTDGGATWDDTINRGPCITQFEFIGQHPNSDAQVIGGTQDNGTEMYRNSLVFYHSADGDGGQAGIDPSNANNVIHTYYSASPERSTLAGKFGTYAGISSGLSGSSLFYPPWTYDDTNSNNLAFGLNKLQLSAAQGTDSWPTSIALPSIGASRVSAIHYVSPSLIYCGTSSGLVYKAVKSGGSWTATLISAAPLPARWIWDIFLVPGMTDVVVLAMAGYGTAHVWKGTLSGGTWTWADISGTSPQRLPDAPANALQIDPAATNTMYVATDVGVYRTTDGGTTWDLFNDGMPNVAVYDLKLHAPTLALRAAAHGRGLWERQLGAATPSDVRVVLRDNIMDTGRKTPSPSGVSAAWEDPLRQVNLNDAIFWWQCADVKVDSPIGGSYQMPIASVDYLAFESTLAHQNPQRGKVNRVYIQVHNRGVTTASNVIVKILYADATPGLPDLPSDFWTVFPANSSLPSPWAAIGAAQTILTLRPDRPVILEWDWTPPMSAATHSCLLAIANCGADPLASTSLVIGTLVTQNRQVGLKNLHLIDPLPAPLWAIVRFYARASSDVFRFSRLPAGWSLGLVLPKKPSLANLRLTGLAAKPLTASAQASLKKQLGEDAARYDLKRFLVATATQGGCAITGVPATKEGVPILVAFAASAKSNPGSVHFIQETKDQRLLGGNTFVLRGKAGKG